MRLLTSLPDPYSVQEFQVSGAGPGSQNTDGLIISSPKLISTQRTGIFIVAGQSNSAAYATGPYTILNPTKLDMIGLYNGGTYGMHEPVLGCNVGLAPDSTNLFVRVFDLLISQGVYDRIIAIFCGVNGTSISHWDLGGDCNQKLIVAPKRLAAVGLSATAVLWQQGESDHGMSQANYSAALSRVIGTPRAQGFVAPWFIAISTLLGGAVDATIQAAQAAAPNGINIFSGANTDVLTGLTNRQAVNLTHFTNVGASSAAALWVTKLRLVF